MERRLAQQRQVIKTRAGISFYEPTYILPYYLLGDRTNSIYESHTPENKPLKSEEFKGQMSVQFSLWYDIVWK
ncbi:phospholipase A [Coxiella-like endosymbiont of Rhipicephalus sanguineus]|uniref:phospholipase A n=1 Tax=Coxiella-like endosymbiont of Rhipicephalus sanguineus TaxID=1955402 RepID=UPI00255A73BB|nr:phospholipase A [Coxiella-like endosymbiont of Rhipicephalus sanguineus]